MKYVLCHTTHHMFFFFSTSIFQKKIHYTHCCALFYYRVEAHRSPASLREGKTGLNFPPGFRSLCPNAPFCSIVISYWCHQCWYNMTYYSQASVVQTNLALLQRMFSRYRPLLIHRGCISLCQVFKSPKNHIKLQGEMYDQSKGSNIIIFWELQVSPTHVFFFPLCGRHASSCEETLLPAIGWTSADIRQGLWEKFLFFRNWNVTFFWPVRERQTSSLRAKQEEFVDSWPELT